MSTDNLTTPELTAAARDMADELATVWSCGTIAFAQGSPRPDLARRLLEEWHKDAKSCGVRAEIMRRYEAAFAMGRYVVAFSPPHPTSPGWAFSIDTHMYHAVEGPLIDRLKEIARSDGARMVSGTDEHCPRAQRQAND